MRLLIVLSILSTVWMYGFCSGKNVKEKRRQLLNTNKRETNHNKHQGSTSNNLSIKKKMKNQKVVSGDTVNFKCYVSSNSDETISFEWWMGENRLDPREDGRIAIEIRSWGSRLKITDVYTSDSGRYSCTAISGKEKVILTSQLNVSFRKPPPANKKEKSVLFNRKAKCEEYQGDICSNVFSNNKIYVDPDADTKMQDLMIEEASHLLTKLSSKLSSECLKYVLPAYCLYMFPTCHVTSIENDNPEFLCREDCEEVKSFCELDSLVEEYSELKIMVDAANCLLLPSSKDSNCKSLNISEEQTEKSCYKNKGENYNGKVDRTKNGLKCVNWPKNDKLQKISKSTVKKNYCQNRNGLYESPWCYVDVNYTIAELCDIQSCVEADSFPYKIVTAVVAFSLVFISVLVFFIQRIPTNRNTILSKEIRSNMKVYLLSKGSSDFDFVYSEMKIPLLKSLSIKITNTMVGSGSFGQIYKANVLDKSIAGIVVAEPIYNFEAISAQQKYNLKKCLEKRSTFNHINITRIKGIIFDEVIFCLLYEFTNKENLHHYLRKFSYETKQVDLKPLLQLDKLDICRQVANGMRYLESKGFTHKDLAARNVLVCEGNIFKIIMFQLHRKEYQASYERIINHTTLVPLRWMSPEAIFDLKYSDKSDVWSFGVFLWEIFSDGTHPYENEETDKVSQMIQNHQLLLCPYKCKTNVYSLMLECWNQSPLKRPSFQSILSKIDALKKEDDYLSSYQSSNQTYVAPPSYNCINNTANIQRTPLLDSSKYQDEVMETNRPENTFI